MAGIIGGEAGYASVAPTRNYVGEALSNVQDNIFRQNTQRASDERAKKDAEQTIIENRRKDFAEAQELAKQNPFIATGTGLDASNRQSYMNAKKVAAEAQANFMSTGDQKYSAIFENAVASIQHLSEIPNKLNAMKEDRIKNASIYNPQSLLKKNEIINKMSNGEIVQTNDDNGNPRYSIFDRDENGNLSKIAHKELSGQQLLALLEPVKSFNITGEKGFVDQFQKSIGKAIPKEEIIGGQIVKSLYTPGSQELAKTMAQAATKNKSAVYAGLQELGLDPEDDNNYTDEKVLKQVADNYETLLNKNAPNVETSRMPNYEQIKIDAKLKQDNIGNRNESVRIKIAQEVAGKDKKGIRFTVKDGLLGRETSATMNMTEGEYADYLIKNGVKDARTLDEIWSNPINAGYAKAVKNSPEKAKPKETAKDRALRLARK